MPHSQTARQNRRFSCVSKCEGMVSFSVLLAFLIAVPRFRTNANPVYPEPVAINLTNTLQVRRLASREDTPNCRVRLDGTVLWVSPARDQLVLQDDSGGM